MTKKTDQRRMREPVREELNDAQRKVFDAIVAGPRGSVPGPLAAWLPRPEFMDRAQRLGEYTRYQTSLGRQISELVVLIVARFWGAEFEWWAHKPMAIEAGLSPEVVEQIRLGQVPIFNDADLATVYEFAIRLLENREIDDSLFNRTKDSVGEGGVVDLVGILGYYSLVSFTIKTFRVPLPEGASEELL